MNNKTKLTRKTKYHKEIINNLTLLKHATNSELLLSLRLLYPDLSPTTVHRVTSRLSSNGNISLAPLSIDGSIRYDINTKQHDHLHCLTCDCLQDIDIKDKLINILNDSKNKCSFSGRLIINVKCKKCIEKERLENENNNL